MKRNVGLTYVKDFSFPAEQGFSGSTGKAKGYKHGGRVKKHGGPVKRNMGGSVGLGQMGGMGQEREIQVDDVTITTPRAKGGRVGKKHGGYMKGGKTSSHNKTSMHDKLKSEGAKLGYAYGGRVKNTSPEFVEKHGKQKTMDTGTQPARRGRNQAEIEAGGTKRMLPGLHKGGGIKGSAHSGGGALADAAIKHAKKVLHPKKGAMKKPLKASAAGMPKNVKSHGGEVHKARGGSVKK